MKSDIFIFSDGVLSRKDNTLFLETAEKRKFLPVENINAIYAFGEVHFNKTLLELLAEKEIVLHYYNYYGYYTGSFYPREHLNSGFVILKQAEHYLDHKKRMTLARLIIQTALENMRVVLKYYNARGKNLQGSIDKIADYKNAMEECASTEQLMALEGNTRELYYQAFNDIIQDKQFLFHVRSRRLVALRDKCAKMAQNAQ